MQMPVGLTTPGILQCEEISALLSICLSGMEGDVGKLIGFGNFMEDVGAPNKQINFPFCFPFPFLKCNNILELALWLPAITWSTHLNPMAKRLTLQEKTTIPRLHEHLVAMDIYTISLINQSLNWKNVFPSNTRLGILSWWICPKSSSVSYTET